MTIKEAFESLAKATSKGMKNPFFVMRGLNKAFSEVAGSVEGGGINYSTEEQNTGLKWTDGKDIYQKTYKFLPPFVANNNTFTLDISGVVIRSWEVYALDNGEENTTIGEGSEIRTVNANGSRIIIWIANGTLPYLKNAEINVTVRYTK